ncbi:flavodoxin domain-containing protein [bacterium]|nr:flavodoxin domain-containing protein [bacterium]
MKILVGYASGYGATQAYAEFITEALQQAGHEVEALDARKAKQLDDYDHVIIGGSIRAGNWLGHATKLTRRVIASGKPYDLFVVCLSALSDEGRAMLDEKFFPKLREKIPGVQLDDVGIFPGMKNFEQYRFLVKGIMQNIARKNDSPTEGEQDFKDFDIARGWVGKLKF